MAWNHVEVSHLSSTATSLTYTPTIAILKPHRGEWYGEYVEAMWNPLKNERLDWCNKSYFMCRVPSLPLARNILVKEALKSNAEFFLLLDADHIPETPPNPNEALRLLHRVLQETGESMVTGLYRAKQAHGFNYAIWKEVVKPDGSPGFVHIQDWPQGVNFFEVDVAGAGFMLIRRKVFEDMAKAGYGQPSKPFFHWEDPDQMSEDFDFMCKVRKEFGYKVWCFADVRLSHMGELVLLTDGSIRVPRI